MKNVIYLFLAAVVFHLLFVQDFVIYHRAGGFLNATLFTHLLRFF